MNLSQLEKDLTNRIHERLMLWVKDSIQLCEIVEMPEHEGVALIVHELAKCLVAGSRTLGITKFELLATVNEMWKDVDRRKGHVHRENED